MLSHVLSLVPPQVWADIVSAALTALGAWLVAKLQKGTRTANMALAVDVATQIAKDALAKWQPGQSKDQIIADATASAKKDLLAAMPNLEKSLEAELDVLIHGAVIRTVQAPGGSTVTLPSPVPGA
jgi:hypothetical protein